MTPTGRSRGTASAMRMKIVASIQYTLKAYLVHPPPARNLYASMDVLGGSDALEDCTHGNIAKRG